MAIEHFGAILIALHTFNMATVDRRKVMLPRQIIAGKRQRQRMIERYILFLNFRRQLLIKVLFLALLLAGIKFREDISSFMQKTS